MLKLNLRIGAKLAVVVCLLILPLILLVWLFVQQSFKDIDFAKKESSGNVYLKGAWPVLRGLAGTWANPGAPLVAAAPDLAALGAAYDAELDIGDAGRELRAIMTKLGWPPRISSGEAQADGAIAAARSLITKIADGSNLTLDPDLDSYYVMDAVTAKLPEAIEKAAALAALSREHKSKTDLSDDDKAGMMIHLGLFRAAVAGTAASLESAAKANAGGEVRRRLDAAAASFAQSAERFSAETMTVAMTLRDDARRRTIDLSALTARSGETLAAADALWREAAGALDDLLRARAGGFQSRLALMLGLAGAIVAIALLFVWIIVRGITRPLDSMQRAMHELAGGNFDVVLPGLGRKDEIGAIAAAVEEFKVKAADKARLEAEERAAAEAGEADKKRLADEHDAAQQRAAEEKAAAERKAAMHKLADDFEKAVGAIVDKVSSASGELEAAASTLTRTAETTQQLSTVVASASEEASANVQSVATATEEMTGSVGEISRQVQESSNIAGEAVRQAQETDKRINELSQAASRIGDVVKLITAVAEQTNLLALNATIEAARAGEAGRGFAVVASEVKALAGQTAKATSEISSQIAGMQSATQDSVSAIKQIGGTIGRISEIAATIAAAVEEQGAATQEIARNVQEASKGTAEVASNIVSVNRGAGETGSASSQVLSSAQSLSSESSHLKAEVAKFLATVRAA